MSARLLRFLASLRARLRRGAAWLADGWALAVAMLRSPRQMLLQWPPGEVVLGPRVCVFVHYDRRGAARPYVVHYVRALAESGLSVVLVSNAGRLTEAAEAALRPHCAAILVRRNVGYDFGAMREGLEHFRLPRADTEMVLLVNDSVYGPFTGLASVLDRIDFAQADVWGATESWQRSYHLQSFFLAAGPAALHSAAWRRFWRGVRPVQSKRFVIRRYEVGLTQAVLRDGLRCRAVWGYAALVDATGEVAIDSHGALAVDAEEGMPAYPDPVERLRRIQAHRIRHHAVTSAPLNPTSDLWRQLLRAGFPFLKRELLRNNPTHVADIADWREEVVALSGAVPEWIETDLRRTLRDRAP